VAPSIPGRKESVMKMTQIYGNSTFSNNDGQVKKQIFELDTTNRNHVKLFTSLPFQIYQSSPQWVPPLQWEVEGMLDRKHNPFFKHSEAAFFLALENGRVVGRVAALYHVPYNTYNHEKTAFFYLFECEDNLDTAKGLFDRAMDWARQKGLGKMIGPKGFNALNGMGLLVKGFELRPAMGIPYNLSYYPRLIEENGFEMKTEIVSGYLNRQVVMPEKVKEVANRVQERRGLSVMEFKTRRDLRKLVPRLRDMYNQALEGTEGNAPLSDEEAQEMARQILWFADPRLIKIIMHGEDIAGFLFAYPDISKAIQRVKGRLFPFGWIDLLFELRRTKWMNINGAGMLEKYRGGGGTAVLFNELYKSVKDGKFEHIDVVQVGVENTKMQRELEGLGIDFYKTHRLYQREI
jgi:hypothetical protein